MPVHPGPSCWPRSRGPELVTVFTAGCCGDVNHIDVNWASPSAGFANAARMGTILAAEVLRTWPRLEAGRSPARVRAEEHDRPAALPGSRRRRRGGPRGRRHRCDSKTAAPSFLETVQAFKVLDVVDRNGQPLEVEVQVIALGDEVAWVSLPGEIFVELGLAIKQDSPFRNTMIAELANGAIGYIPSRRAYAQGNYEVVAPVRRGLGRTAGRCRRAAAQGDARWRRRSGAPGRSRSPGQPGWFSARPWPGSVSPGASR